MITIHQNMVTIRQEMVGIHQRKSGDFPDVSSENSQTNGHNSQEMVEIYQEKNPEISGRNTASMFQRFSGVFLQEPVRTT